MPLTIVRGDATRLTGDGPKIIAHVCNDIGAWGRGFVLAISRRWPQPERDYRAWCRGRTGNDFALGATRLVQVAPNVWVANMIAQHGIRPGPAGPPIRHAALERCLTTVGEHAQEMGATVHMPRIGCGLAGGRWEDIEPILARTLHSRGIAITVYDLSRAGKLRPAGGG